MFVSAKLVIVATRATLPVLLVQTTALLTEHVCAMLVNATLGSLVLIVRW